jgi:phosphoribosylformylglycinamidine synthase
VHGIDSELQIALAGLDDAGLRARLHQLGIRLRLEEARTLVQLLERDPTRAELALLQSMWSEHCSYKSSRALLGRLPTQAPNVVSGPGADAGIVGCRAPAPTARCGSRQRPRRAGALCRDRPRKPQPPEPIAAGRRRATGIGGIVRDVYCMGADVVGVLDALRFGDPDGAKPTRRGQITRGVVHGISAYGNALGVPNLGGDVEFDAAFDDNCLVNVVAIGLVAEDAWIPSVVPAVAAREPYVLLLAGKPTDDSGLGGAAFASGVLDTDETTQERGACSCRIRSSNAFSPKPTRSWWRDCASTVRRSRSRTWAPPAWEARRPRWQRAADSVSTST